MMILTKDEIIAIVCDRLGMFSNDAVEDLADELIRRWDNSQNGGKPIVSGLLQVDPETNNGWFFDYNMIHDITEQASEIENVSMEQVDAILQVLAHNSS